MKKALLLVFLAIPFLTTAQKVKVKKGKVFVDKKETLIYETTKLGTVYKTLDGKPLFRLTKESVEKANPNKNKSNTAEGDYLRRQDYDSNQTDALRRGNRYKSKIKVNYLVVSFYGQKLEYETTLSVSKLIRQFYSEKVINESGLVIPIRAELLAKKIAKDVSGKRKYREN